MHQHSGHLRKLTKLELIYDNEANYNNSICTRSFLVHLHENEQINLNLIKQALFYLVRRNPILACHIVRTDNENERYFNKLEESEILTFSNVNFIETSYFYKWIEIMDK